MSSQALNNNHERSLLKGSTPHNGAEQGRPNISRVADVTRALVLLARGRSEEALTIASANGSGRKAVDEQMNDHRKIVAILLHELQDAFALPQGGEAVFRLQGDYYTITFHGEIAHLKNTRGLCCLSCLLRNPGREFHVSELITRSGSVSALLRINGNGVQELGLEVTTSHPQTSCPMLDLRAKAEFRQRLGELREDLEEAEQFDDRERAARTREEMNAIAEQLASAVGLGGRDRSTGSDAERARSAVTKRIKESIHKISELIPSLGHHLGATIKTGYFCSYNSGPNRPVAWKF